MGAKPETVKKTIRVRKDVWDGFMKKLYEEHGKTHGVIASTIVRFIKGYVEGVVEPPSFNPATLSESALAKDWMKEDAAWKDL